MTKTSLVLILSLLNTWLAKVTLMHGSTYAMDLTGLLMHCDR